MKGRINGRTIRIAANSSPFKQAEAHLVETVFYDEWASSKETFQAKPSGTFVSMWENIENDPKPKLRGLLERKKKRKKASVTELDSLSHYVRLKMPDGRIVYRL